MELQSIIDEYESLMEQRDENIKSLLSHKLKGCRGQLAKNLIGFGITGEWSVVSQSYFHDGTQYKLPFVCIRNVLKMLVETRRKVQSLEEEDPHIDELIIAFQVFKVHMQEDFMDANKDKYDYMAQWSNASSWFELTRNPLKNNSKWNFFFTTKAKPMIDELMNDIDHIITHHDKLRDIDHKMKRLYNRSKKQRNDDTKIDSLEFMVKNYYPINQI